MLSCSRAWTSILGEVLRREPIISVQGHPIEWEGIQVELEKILHGHVEVSASGVQVGVEAVVEGGHLERVGLQSAHVDGVPERFR